ncbi:MAG TPA: DinB family protein [Candidatus Limnocylindrales bacterium]|nr:DinB family protein [Candidatus Limnocylindrales bacterium]
MSDGDESSWQAALIDRLASGPGRVAAAARRAGIPAGGEWSALQVVRHLVATESLVWQARLEQLEASAGAEGRQLSPPTWVWLEPGPWSGPGDDTIEGTIAELRRRRVRTLELVRRLDAAGWRRFGIHATYGRLDVGRLLTVAVDHDAEHLGQIEALIPGQG